MDDWLRSIVNTALGPLKTLVAGISKRLTSLWSVISTFLGLVRTEWRKLRSTVTGWIDAQIRHAVAVATTLKWLTFTYLPRKLGALAASVQAWALEQLSRLESRAVSLFDGAISWAATHIQGALNAISSLRSWAIGQFNALFDPVSKMAKLVFGFLTDPRKLAEWAVGAIVDALVGFAKSNTHRLEALLVSQRAVIWRLVMSVVEDILSELL